VAPNTYSLWVVAPGPYRSGYSEGVTYRVQTSVFEGPIDLLLHLVSTREVEILEIPLAPLVGEFVTTVTEARETISTDTLSQFLVVASMLCEIKSQRLLPGPDVVEADEEFSGFEERDLLLARLLECQAYAAAADVFVALAEQAARSIPREAGLDEGFVVHAPDLLAGVSPERFAQAYLRATAERPAPRVDLSHVTVDTVTVSETVQVLASFLPKRGQQSFRSLVARCTTSIEIIVHFLALLELTKLGKVNLVQAERFGDLEIEWIGEDNPEIGALIGAEEYDG